MAETTEESKRKREERKEQKEFGLKDEPSDMEVVEVESDKKEWKRNHSKEEQDSEEKNGN